MKLLLDLGNTRLKWAWLDATGRLGTVHASAWDQTTPESLLEQWQGPKNVMGAWAASVADETRQQGVAAAVEKAWGVSVTWVHSPARGCGVRSAYARPADLGVDRFLSMVAAHAEGLAPCVLASCGTALVLDALHADGRHAGGLIAPGPQLMQQSVRVATARVRPDSIGQVVDAASSTSDALASGCWQAGAGLVERFVRRMRDSLGGHPRLLLAGGDAATMQPLLDLPGHLYPDAVLKGLAVWATRP